MQRIFISIILVFFLFPGLYSQETITTGKNPGFFASTFYSPSSSSVIIPCDGAQVACSNNIYTYPAGTTGTAPPSVSGYPNYGCIGGFTPGPAWFYMQVGVAGNIIIFIQGTHDVDFVCWGPFTSLSDGCTTGLTGGNIVDCSFSPMATETCHILNAQVGEIYILLITNFTSAPGIITFQQTGGTGVTNCNILVHCSMIALTGNPSTCNSSTNTFSITGNIEFTNPPPSGTLTVTDNTAVPPLSQTFSPPFISPLTYNLTGITCDGATHFLTAAFSDSTSCTITQQFISPSPSCPVAQISGSGEICNNGTSTIPVNISLAGVGPYNFIYAINGAPQPSINNYSGPSPYVINTNIPGTYTLVSVSNSVCIGPGTISGTASVILDPLPIPAIGGPVSVCSGSTGNVYTTEAGNSNYLWSISSGGNPTSGGTGNDHTITVSWNLPGSQTVSVNYHDPKGCTAASSTVFPVTVNSLPTPTIIGNNNVCIPTTGVIYTTQPDMTNYQWTVSGGGTVTSGGTSTDNSVTVIWNTVGLQSVSVNYQNTNGCIAVTSTVYPVPVNPLPGIPGNITGTTVLCQGSTGVNYNVGAAANATSYLWTLLPGTAGTITGNTTSITIAWSVAFTGNATLSAEGMNSCGNGAPSPSLSILVNPKPQVSFTMCTDSITIPTARIIHLKEGIPLGGSYSGTGVNTAAGTFNPATFGFGPHGITYTYTNIWGCMNTASRTITVTNPGLFSCGANLTDVRDNRIYKTIQIGSQCWLATNLNYGTMIPSNMNQRDNCIPEKYCYNDITANCELGTANYEWDELMQYNDTPADQGLCPPSWHIPTEAEWNTLFSVYINNGFAASPLKYSGYSGFNALLSGTVHMNRTTDWSNFATFFWSSSSYGTTKAWAHGMNDADPSVSEYPSLRTNAFSVRCLKD
ncbi:MAG: hypothetical protein NTX61_14520 [Bacteroidetes bacterium]|nr:hypothetical protein [Bacteroidota bacterium]